MTTRVTHVWTIDGTRYVAAHYDAAIALYVEHRMHEDEEERGESRDAAAYRRQIGSVVLDGYAVVGE